VKKLIVGGFAALAIAAASSGLATPANAAGELITYVVESNGPLMSLSFFDGMNELQSLSNPGFNTWSPGSNTWSANFRSQATYQLTAISAMTKGTQVTCRIVQDGTVMDEKTTVGRYTMASCGA
jgi:hypothetical protein